MAQASTTANFTDALSSYEAALDQRDGWYAQSAIAVRV
jgi:hypothetical protein